MKHYISYADQITHIHCHASARAVGAHIVRSHDIHTYTYVHKSARTHTRLPNTLSSTSRALSVVLKPSRPISVSFPSAEKRGELNGQPVLNPRKEKERKKETEKGRRERKKGERERGGCLYSALRSHAQIIVNAAKNVSRLDVRSGLHCRTQPAPRSSGCPNRPPSPRLTGFNPVTAASLSSFFTLFT